MFMKRRVVRERTVFAVYDALLYGALGLDFDAKSVLCGAFMCKYKDVDPEYADVFAKALLHRKEIEEKVDEFLRNWSFRRLSWLSQAIFLVSYAETVLVQAVPKAISIDEAVEIARKYVSDGETKYVNAVLDRVLGKALGAPRKEGEVEVDPSSMEDPSEDEVKRLKKASIPRGGGERNGRISKDE